MTDRQRRERRGDDERWEKRLALLEAESRQHHSTQTAIRRDIEKVRESIEALTDKVSKTGRVPSSTMASWASVILVLVGMVAAIIVRDTNRLESAMAKIAETQVEHALSDGHSGVRVNSEAIDRLRSDLEREIELYTQDRFTGSEARLLMQLIEAQHERLEALNCREGRL